MPGNAYSSAYRSKITILLDEKIIYKNMSNLLKISSLVKISSDVIVTILNGNKKVISAITQQFFVRGYFWNFPF